MDRREFLKQVALWSAGLIVTPPIFSVLPEALSATSKSLPVVSIAKGKDYIQLVSKVLEPLGGIQKFVKKGDKVVVKPNIGWDRSPEQAATTHPDVVKAIVLLALDAGASSVQVFDLTCNDERRCYANSGIKNAVESIHDKRVSCSYIDKRRFVPVNIERGESIRTWEFYKDALEADCYINVPIAKHHGLTKITLGMKNIMGVIGGNRGYIHFNMDQNLADLNLVIRPKLNIIDATRILLNHGPQGGNPDDVKILDTLVASSDIIAADSYAARFFGIKPSDLGFINAGYKMGLGQMDLRKVKIIEA